MLTLRRPAAAIGRSSTEAPYQGNRAMPELVKARRQGACDSRESPLLSSLARASPHGRRPGQPQRRASEFTLANGMQVVVVPDRRAPVVTHVVWYRIGGADNIAGQSGLAHFLEHLMFKSTAQAQDRRAVQRGGAPGRARQRRHHARRHLLLPAAAQGASEDGDGHGSRPHAQPEAGRHGGGDGAAGGDPGAPLGGRQQAAGHPRRADDGGSSTSTTPTASP